MSSAACCVLCALGLAPILDSVSLPSFQSSEALQRVLGLLLVSVFISLAEKWKHLLYPKMVQTYTHPG